MSKKKSDKLNVPSRKPDYNAIIYEADELIRSTHRMDENELTFFYYALAARKKGETFIEVNFKEMVKVLIGNDKIYRSTYDERYLKAIDNISEKSKMDVWIEAYRISDWEKKSKTMDPRERVHVNEPIIFAEYFSESKTLYITFNQKFLPLLDNLNREYTQILYQQIRNLRHNYSKRIYEWARMHLKNLDSKTFTWYIRSDSPDAPSIRRYLNLDADGKEKYKQWSKLEERVLLPCITEINKTVTDLSIAYKPAYKKREGGGVEVTAINVTITRKKKIPVLQEPEDETKMTLDMYSERLTELSMRLFNQEITPQQFENKLAELKLAMVVFNTKEKEDQESQTNAE
jgi:hypothetical protein